MTIQNSGLRAQVKHDTRPATAEPGSRAEPAGPSHEHGGGRRQVASLKHAQRLRVPVSPADKRAIEANAQATGLTVATYLRQLALQRPVTGILDLQAVAELARVAADQGRLGGLMKLFLTQDDKLDDLGGQRDLRARVVALLHRILETQKQIEAVIERVVP